MSHGLLRHTLAAFWLCMASASALAAGPPPPERFRLTPQLLERMEALQAASPEAARPGDDDEPDAQSVQELARQLDADPRIRALLARHRVSSIEYASAVYAALHAGMFLAMESLADKASRTSALASFTPEQRANIELLRRRPIK